MVMVFFIVKKWIRIWGRFVVLRIRVKFNEIMFSGFLNLFFGFKKLLLRGVVVFILENILVKLKLNFENMIMEIMNVLIIRSKVLIICI